MCAQPFARLGGSGARGDHVPPERRRMIEPLEVHQLVNQHVLADKIGHQHQPPVQADMPLPRARSPARSLVPHADARYGQAVQRRQPPQLVRKIVCRARSQRCCLCRKFNPSLIAALFQAPALPLDPRLLLAGKIVRPALGPPAGNRHPHTAVGLHADHIAAGARMPDEEQ